MNKKLRRQQLAEDLRRTAPLLKRMGNLESHVPKRVLQAFRASHDKHFPPPPPVPEEQLVEWTMQLLAEEPKDVDELVTGLRLKSVRCDEKDVEKLLNRMTEFGWIVEALVATGGRGHRLTATARRLLGLANPRAKVLSMIERQDAKVTETQIGVLAQELQKIKGTATVGELLSYSKNLARIDVKDKDTEKLVKLLSACGLVNEGKHADGNVGRKTYHLTQIGQKLYDRTATPAEILEIIEKLG